MKLKFIIFFIVFQLLFSPLSSSFADPGILDFIQSPSLEKPLGKTFGLFGYEIGVIGSAVLESLWSGAVDSFFNSVIGGVEKKVTEAICDAAKAVGKAAGAAVGAAAGSVVPGAGTVVGAAVGSVIGGLLGGNKCDLQKVIAEEQKKTTKKLFQLIKENIRKNLEPLSRDFFKGYLQTRLSREMGKIIESYKVDSIEEYLQIAEKRGKIKGLRDYLQTVSCLTSDVKSNLQQDLRDELETLQVANYFLDLLEQVPDCIGGQPIFATVQIANEIRSNMIEFGNTEREQAKNELTGDIAPKINCTQEIELDTGEMFCLDYTILIDSKTLAQSTEETVKSSSENINLTEDVNTLVSFLKNFDALRVLSIAQMGYQGLTQGQDLDTFLENYYENFKNNIDKACEIYKEQISPGSFGQSGLLGGALGLGISALKKTVGGGKTEEYILCKVLMKKQLVFMLQGRNEIETAITRVLSLGISDVNTLSYIVNTTTEKIRNLGNKILGTGTSTSNLPSYLVIARLAQEGRINEIPVPPDIVNKYLKAVKLHEDVVTQHSGNINVINNRIERLRDDTYREYTRNLIKEFAPIENRLTNIANTRDSLASDIQGKANILSQKAEINSTIISKYQNAFDDYNQSNWPTFHKFPATKCDSKVFGSISALCPGESVTDEETSEEMPGWLHLCRKGDTKFVRGRGGYNATDPVTGEPVLDCKDNGDTETCRNVTTVTNFRDLNNKPFRPTKEQECAALACVHWKDYKGFPNPFYINGWFELPNKNVKTVCDFFNLPVPNKVYCHHPRKADKDDCQYTNDPNAPPDCWALHISVGDGDPDTNAFKITRQHHLGRNVSECKVTHSPENLDPSQHPNGNTFVQLFRGIKKFLSSDIWNYFKNIFQTKAADLVIITNPKNNQEVTIGQTLQIQWNPQEFQDKDVFQIIVSLKNLDTNRVFQLIALTPPANSFTWKVGQDMTGDYSIFPGRYILKVTYLGFKEFGFEKEKSRSEIEIPDDVDSISSAYVLDSDKVTINIAGKMPIKEPIDFSYPEKKIEPISCDWARIYNPKWVYRVFPSLWKFGSPINSCPYQTSTSSSTGGGGGGDGGDGGNGDGGNGNGSGGGGNQCQEVCLPGEKCVGGECIPWPPGPVLMKIKESLFALFQKWFSQKAKAQSVSVDLKVEGSDGPLTKPANTTVQVSWEAENADSCQVTINDAAGDYNPRWLNSTKAGAQHHIYNSRKVFDRELKKMIDIPITFIQYVATCDKGEESASDAVMVYVGQVPTPASDTGAIEDEDIITSLKRFLKMLGGTDPNKITDEAKKRYLLTGQASQGSFCGNGICEPSLGENALTCSIDCTGGGGEPHRPPRELYLKLKDSLFSFVKNTLFQKIFSSEQAVAQSQNICKNCELKKGQRRFLFDIVNIAYMDFRPNVDRGQSSFLDTLNIHLASNMIKNLRAGFGSVPADIDLIGLKTSPEQLAEIKAYLNLKLNIVRALLKYVNKFPKRLDITLGSPYFPPVITTAQFLKEYQSLLENLISMINIHLGGSFQENLQQLLQADQEVVRLSNKLDETQDEVLPKVLEKFAKNDVPVYAADVWKVKDRVDVLQERESAINKLLDEVEAKANAILSQRKINQGLVKIEPKIQKSSAALPTLPKLIKSLFQPKKINIKNEI